MESAGANPELHIVGQSTAGPEVVPEDLPRPPRTWVIYDEAGGGVEMLVGSWLRISVQFRAEAEPAALGGRPPRTAGEMAHS